jgi:carotenoid cleavage dioxygenase-like enzyme
MRESELITDEHVAVDLMIYGDVPSDFRPCPRTGVNGAYLRNGTNPLSPSLGSYTHPIDGGGTYMVHDFIIAASFVVLCIAPAIFDFAMAGMRSGQTHGGFLGSRFEKRTAARIVTRPTRRGIRTLRS